MRNAGGEAAQGQRQTGETVTPVSRGWTGVVVELEEDPALRHFSLLLVSNR